MDSYNPFNPHGIVLWMDDIRQIRGGFDVWAKNGEDAMILIRTGNVRAMSFDSDMGPGMEGVHVSKEIQGLALHGSIPPIRCCVHTANADARRSITADMMRAYEFWEVDWEVEHDYNWDA